MGQAQAPVHGHFWADLAGPFFVAGAGTAFAFIPVSIAGLAGVGERDAGLASGCSNTSQQIGGAIGVAVASTVVATHVRSLARAGATGPAALTGGFQWALWVWPAPSASPACRPRSCFIRRGDLRDSAA